jgi:maleylpyruvate isomerase
VTAGVVDLLLDDVTGTLTAKDGCPSIELAPTDRDRVWELGAAGATTRIAAPAADLVGWLTGRLSRPDRPPLPRWL